MNKIEHIGIAVSDINSAKLTFEQLLGTPAYKEETVESEGVKTVFFKVGDVKIELLEATRDDSPIAKYINKKGQGIHHIAFDVDSVEEKANKLRQENFLVLNDTPKDGADNKSISFIHPKSTNGVLVELCQEKDK